MREIDARWWMAWALGGIVWAIAFIVLETLAILSPKTGDTLTEVVRSWHLPGVLWFLGGGVLAGFAVWWPLHLKLGW
jgi:hypothetical protein